MARGTLAEILRINDIIDCPHVGPRGDAAEISLDGS